ncbi:DUF2877 domain-containing protein [Photobacterium sp.]|uniref:DUF2877 domain-containing protein n=1 Tax=Photobacterium sp. TaxID=660 RepID=UPI00299D7181|nr:DUF2877 domain-containing protein [Photobacterium sp.]MDX1301429.1 DUF2877 domain-containing protein [Photobacterium sp.]
MKAIKISRPICDIIDKNGTITTTIHSIYKSTCNLKSENRLISLLLKNKQMNPASIMLDSSFFDGQMAIGDTVELTKISNNSNIKESFFQLYVDTDNIDIFDPSLPCHHFIDFSQMRNINKYLAKNETEMGIYPLLCKHYNDDISSSKSYYSSMMENYITPYLNDFINELENKSHSIDLKFTIGFGAGLTPSFDDLLVGLMSFLVYTKNDYFQVISSSCLIRVDQTTDISREMLLLATKKQFNEDIINLYNAIDNEILFMDRLDKVMKYGHSSGHDTLCGIYLGVKLFGFPSNKKQLKLL